MSLEDMETLIKHTEWVANIRPISYITQNNCELPLTPNMLLFGRYIMLEITLDHERIEDPDYKTINVKDLDGHFIRLLNSMKDMGKKVE